jgi:hypothetical protein
MGVCAWRQARAHSFSQPAVRFEEMTCDFVRDPERRWWLLQVKSFKLQKAVQTLT